MNTLTTNMPDINAENLLFAVPAYDAVVYSLPPYVGNGSYAPLAEQKIAYGGRDYLLRTLYNNLIAFRDAARNLPEWTYFLQSAPACVTAATLTVEQFSQALERGEYGRMVGCKPGGKFKHHIWYLLMSVDGIGLCPDDKRYVDFTWDWRQMGLDAPEDLLTADVTELDLLTCRAFSRHCADIMERQISSRLHNPYVKPGELKESPYVFHCGSEEELQRVTTWICHSDPDLFIAPQTNLAVQYLSPAPGKRVGFKMRTPPLMYKATPVPTPRLKSLLRLAYKHNAFSGWKWLHSSVESPLRRAHYHLDRHWVSVPVLAPSAHERAEALLSLADWLEGKVPPKKKLRLRGLE